jgi:hypothetical protein
VEGSPLQRGFLSKEVLRELNDRLAEIQSGKGDELLTMLCECAEPFCAEQVAVGRDHFGPCAKVASPCLLRGIAEQGRRERPAL